MKIILIPLTALFLMLNFEAHSQVDNDSASHLFENNSLEHNLLLKKSHNQKVTATILGISGGAMCLTEVALAAINLGEFYYSSAHHHNYGNAPEILGIGEPAIVSAGIPFSFMAKKNKKKAMLCLQGENVRIVPGNKKYLSYVSGIAINL